MYLCVKGREPVMRGDIWLHWVGVLLWCSGNLFIDMCSASIVGRNSGRCSVRVFVYARCLYYTAMDDVFLYS